MADDDIVRESITAVAGDRCGVYPAIAAPRRRPMRAPCANWCGCIEGRCWVLSAGCCKKTSRPKAGYKSVNAKAARVREEKQQPFGHREHGDGDVQNSGERLILFLL